MGDKKLDSGGTDALRRFEYIDGLRGLASVMVAVSHLAHAAADSPFRDATRFAQNPEALDAVRTASLSRWQRDLDKRDKRIFKRTAGSLIVELGDARDETW